MATKPELETDEPSADEPQKIIPPRKKGTPAMVTTTVKYNAEVDTDNEKESNEDNNGFGKEIPAPDFASRYDLSQGERPYSQTKIPRNRLAEMFDELNGYDENETFYALITRRADFLNDDFRKSCSSPVNFAPLPITAKSFFTFIPTIQKANGNSGGRFDITIVDEETAPLELGIVNLVIPNPEITEQPTANPNADLLTLVREIQAQSDERFRLILETIKPQPQEKDRFAQLAERHFENVVLNPQPQEKKFDTDEFIAKIFGSQAIIETISTKFSESFNKGDSSNEKKTILDRLLENEMVVNKASDLLNSVVDTIDHLAEVRMASQIQSPQYQPIQQEPIQMPPSQEPPAPQPASQTQQDMEHKEIINKIITELESDNPINGDNATVKELAEAHTDLYEQLKVACKVVKFEKLLDQLEDVVPDTFDQFYNEDETLNERGEKVKARLQELYKYLASLELAD